MTPNVVDAGDKATRRAAARVVATAFLTVAHPWILGGVFGALYWGVLAAALAPAEPAAVLAPLFLLAGVLTFSSVLALSVYVAPTSAHKSVYYVDNGHSRAALIIGPDRRRRQLAGDMLAAGGGAWPKGKGAGTELGEYVRDQVHATGGRVTLTATPWGARRYRKKGLVDDGRTALFLPRLASKARAGVETVKVDQSD